MYFFARHLQRTQTIFKALLINQKNNWANKFYYIKDIAHYVVAVFFFQI